MIKFRPNRVNSFSQKAFCEPVRRHRVMKSVRRRTTHAPSRHSNQRVTSGFLRRKVATNTRQIPYNEGYHAIPREWERKEPQRFDRAVAKLNAADGKVCAVHDELVRAGRGTLL